MRGEYMLFLLVISAFPIARSMDRNLPVRNHPGVLFRSIFAVSAFFWVWDVLAAIRGHWSFNPAYVLGFSLLGLPAEEWLFFLIVGYVAIFTWESILYFTRKR